jgi:hypothetical protein
MADQRYVDGLRAQIEGEERELKRPNLDLATRQGIEMNLEYLRAELRAELGETVILH